MATTAVTLLRHQLEDGYATMRRRLDGLGDDEFWWEPVPGCWTVRRTDAGRWAADYELPDPEPAPLTTIAWRLAHIVECKVMYHEYAFGAAQLTWPEIDSVHAAGEAIAALEESQARLVDDLAALTDDDLDAPRRTNWGEAWPTWRIFWTLIDHDIHHGAEIGTLRDLYRVTVREAARPEPARATSSLRSS